MSRPVIERPFAVKRPLVFALSGAWVLCIAVGGAIALRPGTPPDKGAASIGAPATVPAAGTASGSAQAPPFTPRTEGSARSVTGEASVPADPATGIPTVPQQPLLSAPAPNDTAVTPVKQTAEPVTRGVAPSPAAIVQSPQPTMPADVLEWLRHLERIENRRRSLAQSETAQLLAEFSGLISAGYTALADPDEIPSVTEGQRARNINRLSQLVREYRADWDALAVSFWSLRAPAACSQTAADFGKTLGQTSQMMNEVFGFVVNGQESPQQSLQGLYKMTGTSASRIDSPAKAADDGVQSVCDRYGAKKWFSILPDVGGGLSGILSRFGR